MKIAAISIADYAEATEGMPHDVERLFFRMLLKMYSRGAGIPDSDEENAAKFGYKTVRPYKRLKAALIAFECGIYIEDETIKHDRVLREIDAATIRKVKAKVQRSLPEVSGKDDPNLPETSSKPPHSNVGKTTAYEDNYFNTPSPSPSPKESMHASSFFSVEDLRERLWQASAGCMMDDFQDLGIVGSWIRDGAAPDLIIETIEAKAANLKPESIEHYGYFNTPVREAIADQKAGRKNRHVPEKPMTQAEWFAMMRAKEKAGQLEGMKPHGTA